MPDIPRRLFVVLSLSSKESYTTPDRAVANAAVRSGEWAAYEYGMVGRISQESASAQR